MNFKFTRIFFVVGQNCHSEKCWKTNKWNDIFVLFGLYDSNYVRNLGKKMYIIIFALFTLVNRLVKFSSSGCIGQCSTYSRSELNPWALWPVSEQLSLLPHYGDDCITLVLRGWWLSSGAGWSLVPDCRDTTWPLAVESQYLKNKTNHDERHTDAWIPFTCMIFNYRILSGRQR